VQIPAPVPRKPAPASTPEPAVAPAPLTDPLPRVTAVLLSSERRFATIDRGRVVGVGDAIGRRTVVGIDERGLLLREPSGVEVRAFLDRPRGARPTAWASAESM
jgi:hypothetical protein